MTTEAFRSDIVGLVRDWMAANHPTVPVAYENGPALDIDNVGPLWLDVDLRWEDARDATVGIRARGRQWGMLALSTYTKAAAGTQQGDRILDGLIELLRTSRRRGLARLGFPARNSSPPILGWHRAGLLTPFTLDSQ